MYNIIAKLNYIEEGDYMDNNNIILLNLEDKNINLEKSDISKINNVLYCNIVLNTIDEVCPECGSVEYVIKDYQIKK